MSPHDDLPLYAAGALPDDERGAFAAHAAGCARCRSELASYGQVLDELTTAIERMPPSTLRAKVLDMAAGTPQLAHDPSLGPEAPTAGPARSEQSTAPRGWSADPAAAMDPAVATERDPVGATRPSAERPATESTSDDDGSGRSARSAARTRTFALAAAVLVFALLAFGASAVAVWQRSEARDAQVAAAGVDELAAVLGAEDARLVAVETDIGALRVAISSSLDRAVVVGDDVAALPADRAYQVWVLRDGTPRSGGVIQRRDGVLAELEDIAGADAVAVSIEPSSGSQTPTGEIVAEATL